MNIKNFKQKINKKLGKTEWMEKQLSLVNPQFIRDIGPHSNITFKHEKYIEQGDGYMSVIYINKYPKDPKNSWLAELANIANAITVFDIGTDNAEVVKTNLSRSMEEQSSRINNAKTDTEFIDARTIKDELEEMYVEISNMGSVMKLIATRIYITNRELVLMDTDTKKTIKVLESSNYRSGVSLDEGLAEWRAMFTPYTFQQATLYKKIGQPLLTDTLAWGNPFHFLSLKDQYGFYWGYTFVGSGGSVFWDMFAKTQKRPSYNMIACGMMGSGKSEMLKKLTIDRAIRNDKVRIFDVTGEFRELVLHLGGTIISLDGDSRNIINALQILKSSEKDTVSYTAHIAKVATIYKFLDPDASRNHLLILKRLLRKLYMEFSIVDAEGNFLKSLDDFSPLEFPIWSDMLALINREIQSLESGTLVEVVSIDDEKDDENEAKTVTKISMQRRQSILSDLELSVGDICTTYGDIFDAHTSFSNVYNEQIVCFDLKSLLSMEAEVFDAQMFLALSVCWENCVAVGSKMKDLYDKHAIRWNDIERFLIIVDEAHRVINANKLTGVKQIETYEREARKYFGGIALASQSINDFFPKDSSKEGISTIQNLFSFSIYKMMMQQDSSAKARIREAFSGMFTDSEIESIPTLEVGETVLSIAGDRNITFKIERSEEEAELFNGGA